MHTPKKKTKELVFLLEAIDTKCQVYWLSFLEGMRTPLSCARQMAHLSEFFQNNDSDVVRTCFL